MDNGQGSVAVKKVKPDSLLERYSCQLSGLNNNFPSNLLKRAGWGTKVDIDSKKHEDRSY